MITIETRGSSVHLSIGRKTIIIHEMEYSSLKENLFILEGFKRTQIKPEDLGWIDFHLLYTKHKPMYNDPLQRKLDMEYLLNNFSWSSIENYSKETI